jgi:CheY-like chemotaxis protein
MDQKKKILIVEDDFEFRQSLKKLLLLKYMIFEAEDGELAVERLLNFRPDAIILDLLLPKLDGFAVLGRIRNYPDEKISKIPVLVLSNLSSDKDILSIQALKVEGYFIKANTDLQDVYKQLDSVTAKAR